MTRKRIGKGVKDLDEANRRQKKLKARRPEADCEEEMMAVQLAEVLAQRFLLGGVASMKPGQRVAFFEDLLALYCVSCGEENPDDPNESCPCLGRM